MKDGLRRVGVEAIRETWSCMVGMEVVKVFRFRVHF